MANSRAMEDWFLRGGEKPKDDRVRQAPVVTCQKCGGDNLADEEQCTHCGAALAGGTSTAEYCGDDDDEPKLRKFVVTLTQTKSIRQKTRITVMAATAFEAMDRAEDEAPDSDGDWEDVPGSEEYDDLEADDAEEA